jgi:hypothetical protein
LNKTGETVYDHFLTVINICTDHLVGQSNFILKLIDTASVPDFQQTSRECVILTNNQELGITLMLENFTQVFNMEFEIKETVINKNKYNIIMIQRLKVVQKFHFPLMKITSEMGRVSVFFQVSIRDT